MAARLGEHEVGRVGFQLEHANGESVPVSLHSQRTGSSWPMPMPFLPQGSPAYSNTHATGGVITLLA